MCTIRPPEGWASRMEELEKRENESKLRNKAIRRLIQEYKARLSASEKSWETSTLRGLYGAGALDDPENSWVKEPLLKIYALNNPGGEYDLHS